MHSPSGKLLIPPKASHHGDFINRVYESGLYKVCFQRKSSKSNAKVLVQFDFIVKAFGKLTKSEINGS
jgi:hypothetical protein